MAIRRPPTTFSDTISTADIADDAVTGGKLANDIAISTTGNIVTTGSGALTVAGNTTLSGTNNLGSNPTITLGANTTFPTGHVVQTKHNTSANTSITNNTPAWGTYAAEVTIVSPTAGNIIYAWGSTGGYQQTDYTDVWHYMDIMIDDSVNNEQQVYRGTLSYENTNNGYYGVGAGVPIAKYTVPSGSGNVTVRMCPAEGGSGNLELQRTFFIAMEVVG